MEAMGNRKSKLTRDDERDVSERIALGMRRVLDSKKNVLELNVNGLCCVTGMQASSGTKETQYDQRLFNQSQGMTSGKAMKQMKNENNFFNFEGEKIRFW